jgi:hypothetical protein
MIQFWKQTSTTHHRLLSAFDMEKGRMHMAFLQAQIPHPKTTFDYKKSSFEFDVKEVHPTDQIDMHRKTGEMIFSTLTKTSLTASKLQVSLNNFQSQLKLEKISSLAKDNKIKSLEELVLKIGYDPSNVKATEELPKKKNTDITSLRKQLKLLATEDSQAKEMAESEGHKEEMLKLIMEQNAQIKEMEVELDKLVKEKEQSVQIVVIPMDAIPLIGVITTTTTTVEIPLIILVKVPDASEKLVKSMEDMSLQGEEIKKMQEEVKIFQDLKSMFKSSYNKEMHKSQILSQELQKLQKEIAMAKTLSEAKENI